MSSCGGWHLLALQDFFGGLVLTQCASRAQAVAALNISASSNTNMFNLLREDLGASSSAMKIKTHARNHTDKVHPAAECLAYPLFYYLPAR